MCKKEFDIPTADWQWIHWTHFSKQDLFSCLWTFFLLFLLHFNSHPEYKERKKFYQNHSAIILWQMSTKRNIIHTLFWSWYKLLKEKYWGENPKKNFHQIHCYSFLQADGIKCLPVEFNTLILYLFAIFLFMCSNCSKDLLTICKANQNKQTTN